MQAGKTSEMLRGHVSAGKIGPRPESDAAPFYLRIPGEFLRKPALYDRLSKQTVDPICNSTEQFFFLIRHKAGLVQPSAIMVGIVVAGEHDRRGVTTTYQYDGLNRRTLASFGTGGSNTISYGWDAANRLTSLVDSIAGAITRSYDGLDDLTSETTPQGAIGYTYDSARRRQTMTVAGQPQVGYSWDNANRLTNMAQNGASVSFTYDADDRRGSLTLPNGISLSYAYDADWRVAAQSWMAGLTQVADLEYIYDPDGRVIQKTGSLAQTQMPQAVSGNTFNAANEMLTFNGVPLTYDAAGNLTSDAQNTYSWDLRNHLSSISGGSSASFLYDAFGRRAAKVINGTTTQFLYDGLNPVQELDGASPPNPTASLLTGIGIDEYFQRTDSTGSRSFLADALGSTLALTDNAAALQSQYAYEPFGNTIALGQTSANSYQFTGRENDGTGLYYYRARYYDPQIDRFISEDPLGFNGDGPNFYAYVRNNPINLWDAFGLSSLVFGDGTVTVIDGNGNVVGTYPA
ncbi:MAG TPA: RHS repeat-associated core domain-containing protein, partial [Candidatus Binataceae bacterium]|nr:RHS repeat-associated core domain-containing protein [Candidatus Binataceae bacterium]